jgi:3D (Asp-Asp-Asp) domain-containing protein
VAIGAAGSQALHEDARTASLTESIAPPATVYGVALPGRPEPILVESPPVTDGPMDEPTGDPAPRGVSGPEPARRICRVTAYNDRGLTSAGVPSGLGQCAAPADIPLGSRIHIPALGRSFVVTDRTHRRFRNSTVDIFLPCPDRCRLFGCKYLEVEITLPERRHSRPELIQTARRLARTG